MNEAHQPDSAVAPLKQVLSYLAEVMRLHERPVERLADHRVAGAAHFVLYQHELDELPGVVSDTFDDDGAIWLAVEQLNAVDPPPVESELSVWISVSTDPEQRPSIRDSVSTTVGSAEKDRLIAARQARAEECTPAPNPDDTGGIWNVRLMLEDRPDLAAKLDAYVTGQWASWAATERPRRRTMGIYRRLFEIARLADAGGRDWPFELVWGIGVSRWQRQGRNVELPVFERLVEIEAVESPSAQVRIRPRAVGAIANLRAFEALSPEGISLARTSARRTLDAIEYDGELSPFARDNFEPLLNVMCSQLDPKGICLADHGSGPSGHVWPDGGENLVMTDRWVIFARPRSHGFVLRDVDRLKDAIDRTARNGAGLRGVARILALGPGDDASAGERHALPGVIGRPIDIGRAEDDARLAHGDLFFPMSFNEDQIEIVRRIARADGLVVEGSRRDDMTDAIANVICHHLALGLRVLVVSRKSAALAGLRDKLPVAIRELTVSLTTSDREGLKQAETAVRRLQTIAETLKPREQATSINRLERDVIATRRGISDLDDEITDIARHDLQPFPGFADRPLDLAKKLMAERNAHSWFEDRPPKLLAESMLAVDAVNATRAARTRLADKLKYIDDSLPPATELPDGPALVRLHRDLRRTADVSPTEPAEEQFARRAIVALGADGASQLAADLESLAGAHRVIADEPWLGPLSPFGKRDGEASAAVPTIVDIARDAASALTRHAEFQARPVDAPADAITNKELTEIVDRLSAGQKVFTAFALRERKLKPIIDSITISGSAPSTADDWTHVRNYLAWRREIGGFVERWNLRAWEILAPALDPEHPAAVHGLERIARAIDAAISAAAAAERSFAAVAVSKLSMSRGDVEAMLADSGRLQEFSKAVRAAATRLEASRRELACIEGLFPDAGVLPASVRAEILSQIGKDEVDPDRLEAHWQSVRALIEALHERRNEFELISTTSRMIAEAGAPGFARKLRTEPANPVTGDPVLDTDWATAWDWAALMRQMEGLGQHQRLRNLAAQRQKLETGLRELFEALVAARTHLGVAQSMGGAIKQALSAFMVAVRNMEIAGSGPMANRHRRIARAALEDCCEGIPCWIMPSCRVAERLPAKPGAFDLVIIDEAPQSDMRELTALLRGRKLLVVGDEGQAGPIVTAIETDKIDWLEQKFLRGVPKTIRPFLLPGSSLYDLAKVMFPDKFVIGSIGVDSEADDRRAALVDANMVDAPPIAPTEEPAKAAAPAATSEPAPQREAPQREAVNLEEFLDAVVEAESLDEATAQAVKAAWQASTEVPTGDTRVDEVAPSVSQPPIQSAPPPLPPHDTPTPSEIDSAPPRRKLLFGRRALAVAVSLVVVALAVTAYGLLTPNRLVEDSNTGASTPQQESAPPPSDNPEQTEQTAEAARAVQTGQTAQQSPAADAASNDDDGITGAVARAVLLEEDRTDPHGKSYAGSVTWHTVAASPAPGLAKALAVKADVEIPDRHLTMSMSFQRITDRALPASHVIEIKFSIPPDYPYGGIGNMAGIQMKQQVEQIKGAALSGQVAKVTSGFFLFGLSAAETDMQRNLKLLRERSWLDILIVYGSGKRAILAIEKGTPGDRAFNKVLLASGQ